MPKIDDRIADIERKMEQQRNRLRDLKAQAAKQDRKDDARRKLLYGAAYLVALNSLSPDARQRSLECVEAHITKPKDREFLGLGPLKDANSGEATEEFRSEPTTAELPFRFTNEE